MRSVVFGPVLGFCPGTRLGRFAENPVISGAPPCTETSLESKTVNGVPLITVAMPFNCQLPEHLLIPAVRLSPEGKAPLIAEHQAVTRVEQRASAFRSQVERILREIVFAGYGLRCRAGHVERRSVIDRFRVRIRSKE